MKKLMIAACAVACAAAAQAATIKWNSATMYEAGAKGAFDKTKSLGAKDSASTGATGILYYIGAGDYTTWAATLAAATTLEAQQAAMLELAKGIKSGDITATAIGDPKTVSKNAINFTDPKNYTGMTKEDPLKLYAAVIYSYNDGTTDWTIANVGKIETDSDTQTTLASLGANFGGTGGTAIQGWATETVPEPTSGLLLLLGVAGLALRRRRA